MVSREKRKRGISLLSESLRNRIAAGEVVERPASLVKELVENSLDAGATRVDVALERGGQGLVRVADDGWGIPEPELELAVTRHATSKVEEGAELFGTDSFGFRGEALASAAAVSRLRLTSRASGADTAFFIEARSGRIVDQGIDTLASGTRVEVRDLFAEVPARLKFLKSEAAESRRCREALFRISLARPEVAFSLESGGRTLFDLPAREELGLRLAHFWPPSLCERLVEVAGERDEGSVRGLVGRPDAGQGRAERMLFYVNGRPVRDRMLLAAAREAYKGRLLSREYPALVLFLDLPGEMVDVNVHPAKAEVRFSDERAVFSLVRRALLGGLSLPGFGEEARSPADDGERERPRGVEADPEPGPGDTRRPKFATFREFADLMERQDQGAAEKEPGSGGKSQEPERAAEATAFCEQVREYEGPQPPPRMNTSRKEAPSLSGGDVTYLGQVAGTYLVLSMKEKGQERLGLLDQHAAHERVLFETFERAGNRGESRPLVSPLSLPLHGSEAEVLQGMWAELRGVGFELATRGPDLAEISGVPPCLEPGRALDFLRGVLGGEARSMRDLWTSLACRSAVKAGQPLAPAEALALLDSWSACKNREHCPHGRPCLVRLGAKDLERLFKRR